MNHPSKILKDIGEQGLLQRLQLFCPADIIGDDGAVVNLSAGQSLVVTTDVLVEGVHFSDRTTTAFDVGWRGAAANLSDLAAMGANPVGITVGLSLPGNVAVDWVENLYRGLNSCLKKYRSSILGGDITRSKLITVSINAFGQVFPNRVIRRCDARAGDAIVVTGSHGNSRSGLELLLHPEKGQNLEEKERNFLITMHQRPLPRLDVLDYLWQVYEQPRVAGTDSSDGLADAIIQICRCSEVGAKIERFAIPISPYLSKFLSSDRALEYALYGGEDFELVLCLPTSAAKALVKLIGKEASIIGNITPEREIKLIDGDRSKLLTLAEGFQHF